MPFDGDASEHLLTSVGGNSVIIDERRRAIKQALRTFRGTLVDGILQPNVRLGNGLQIVNDPRMERPRESRQLQKQETQVETVTKPVRSSRMPSSTLLRDEQLNTQRAQAKSISKPWGKPLQKPWDKVRAQTTHEELEVREAVLLARERELHAKEETLRWKHKMWSLENKMAKKEVKHIARRRALPRRPVRPRVEYETWKDYHRSSTEYASMNGTHFGHNGNHPALHPEAQAQTANRTSRESPQLDYIGDSLPAYDSRRSTRRQVPKTESPRGSASDTSSHTLQTGPSYEGLEDASPSNDFDLTDPTPPPALSALRSRFR